MALPVRNPPTGFDELSVEEKIEYVQDLWDAILDSGQEIPVPDWHRELVAERLARLRENPEATVPWEDVKAELLRKFPPRS